MTQLSDKERIAVLELQLGELTKVVAAWADTTSHMQAAYEERFSIIRKFMEDTLVFLALLGIVSLAIAGRTNVSESDLEQDLLRIAETPNNPNELSEALRFWVAQLPKNVQASLKEGQSSAVDSQENSNRPKWFRGIFQGGVFVPPPEE